jgi:hypothetical protein
MKPFLIYCCIRKTTLKLPAGNYTPQQP